jgi:hypothetical protein
MVQQPAKAETLLVSVELPGVTSRVMEVVLQPDSTLLLPTQELGTLLGVTLSPAPWTSLDALRKQFPALRITLSLKALTLYIEDDLLTLDVTRAVRAKQQVRAQGAPVVAPSGASFAVAANDRGASYVDAGYSWRGRLVTQVRSGSFLPRPQGLPRSAATATSWAVSAILLPELFVSYVGGEQRPAQVAGRIVAGPAWVSASWNETQFSADGLLTFGRVALYGSSRKSFAVTLRGPVAVQLGHTGNVTTLRASVGPNLPSPFQPPQVP